MEWMPTLSWFGGVAGAAAGFAVEVDEGRKLAVLAADDGDHERKAEGAGADEGVRACRRRRARWGAASGAGAGRCPGR